MADEPRDNEREHDDEFLSELDAEIDEIVNAPTEEHPAPEPPSTEQPKPPAKPTPPTEEPKAEPTPPPADPTPVPDPNADVPPIPPKEEKAPDPDELEPLIPFEDEPQTEEPVAEEPTSQEPVAEEPASEELEHEQEFDEPASEELDEEEEEELDEEEEDFEEDEEELEEAEEEEEEEQETVVAAPSGGGPTDERPVAGNGPPRLRFPLWARFLTASLLIIASVSAATAGSLILFLDEVAADLGHGGELAVLEGQLQSVDGGAPQTILIIGSDKRLSDSQAYKGLSDTSILLRLDPDRNAIALFSIPRDLEVTIPGRGLAKFNEAFSLGGPKLTLETVKALTGLEINHLVNVNFTGFAKAVSAIGCVYVDIDRRYYHSNEGLAASAQYAEIDVRPGYQRLCGYKALEYVRFRHLDNDVVRAARQQDFLREARHKVPAEKLFSDRKELIKIFTDFTTSDIRNSETMLQVLKLFIEAREAPVKEVHFPGSVGASVTATPGQIEGAVSQFLGIEGTAGPRGETATPETGGPKPTEEPPQTTPGATTGDDQPTDAEQAKANAPKQKPKPKPEPVDKSAGIGAEGLEKGDFGRKLAKRVRNRNPSMPVYYPGTIIAGSEYTQKPRAYSLQDHELSPDETFAYKFVLETPAGEYYGMQGLRWKDPPILDAPHEEKQLGDTTYKLYYDNDRLRMVAWETDEAVYWVNNTLLQSLTADQMIRIARGAKLLPPIAERPDPGEAPEKPEPEKSE